MNKKTKLHLAGIISASIALLSSGCSLKNTEVPGEQGCVLHYMKDGEALEQEAPEWVCNPESVKESESMFLEVGFSHSGAAGLGFARKEALADARSNLANRIKVLVKSKIESFARTTGAGDSETLDKVVTAVSKEVSKESLVGSKQIRLWQGKDGTLVALVGISKDFIAKSSTERLRVSSSSYKSDEALWQLFQSKQSLKSLEDEFKK